MYDLWNELMYSTKEHLECNTINICAYLFNHAPMSALLSSWALQTTLSVLRTEAEELTKKEHGLHFRAKTVTAEQVEVSFMPWLVEKMQSIAPSIWRLVFTLVGALDERHSCLVVDPVDVNLSEVFKESEEILGDLGGDIPANETRDEEDGGEQGGEEGGDEEEGNGDGLGEGHDTNTRRRQKRAWRDLPAKNLALWIIVSDSTLLTL
jgi:hypothetical protein